MMPEASLAVRLMMPQGSGDTEQSSLRTVLSDDTSMVYQSGPSFPQPQPLVDPRFPQPSQPSLQYLPVIPPVVPETTGFQGPFILLQTFPQAPGFPQPQAFPPPITVTTLLP